MAMKQQYFISTDQIAAVTEDTDNLIGSTPVRPDEDNPVYRDKPGNCPYQN